ELELERAWRAPARELALLEAAGHLAAEPLCPYPPGIPLLVPGERIDAARADWLAGQALRWPGQIADTVKVVAS
ncbi:MAG: lysine decarboxylase, partial [Prochlorococcaceae cyanobacterium]